jgi:hypothetical protein
MAVFGWTLLLPTLHCAARRHGHASVHNGLRVVTACEDPDKLHTIYWLWLSLKPSRVAERLVHIYNVFSLIINIPL